MEHIDGAHPVQPQIRTKYCQHCGSVIAEQAVICPNCGCQVGEFKTVAQQPNVVITNNNNSNNTTTTTFNGRRIEKNKWVALTLCLLFGYLGAHKFYEGRIGMGILYLLTMGLCGFGWIIDLIILLGKPNPYYIYK